MIKQLFLYMLGIFCISMPNICAQEKNWKNDPEHCTLYIRAHHILNFTYPRKPTKEEQRVYDYMYNRCYINSSWLMRTFSSLLLLFDEQSYERYIEELEKCKHFQEVYTQLQKKYAKE